MNITPLNDHLVVKPHPTEDITVGGIILPESYKGRSAKATVVAAGNGLPGKPMPVRIGDVVFHIKDCGTEMLYNDEKYYIIKQADLLATD